MAVHVHVHVHAHLHFSTYGAVICASQKIYSFASLFIDVCIATGIKFKLRF